MLREQASSVVGALDADRHPLDPLSEAELAEACDILKCVKRLGPDTRFGFVELDEPAKADVLGWKLGNGCRRRAAATVFDGKTGVTRRAVVGPNSKTVVTWQEPQAKTYTYGQPPVIL